MADPIICYFDFASAHTYLGLQKLQDVATKFDRVVDWRPISMIDLWKAHDYMPIGNPIAKGRYIKKDFIRTAGLLGLPLNIPPSFPTPPTSTLRA
jgi:2-hydroxychromene-2-carboxylate isomerase